jgi:hypothetical protein
MMLKAPFRKAALNNLFAVAIFYSFIVLFMIVLPLLAKVIPSWNIHMNVNGGYESFSMIFMFVLGLTCVKDNLKACAVFGRSRNTALITGIMALGTVAAVLAVLDSVFTPVTSIITGGFSSSGLMNMIYNMIPEKPFSYFGTYLVWRLCLYCGITMLGFLLSSINYRLPKVWRLVFWIGFGLLMLVGIPLSVDNIAIATVLARFLDFAIASSPWRFDVTMVVCSAIAAVLAWLIQRRAPVDRS